MTARLILAITSTLLEEIALVVIWRWGLPHFGIHLPLSVLIGVMVAWAAYAILTFQIVTRTLKRKGIPGLPTMVGSRGKVVSPLAPEGMVSIKSELWGAKAVEGNIATGEKVAVVGQDGLKLMVRKSDTEQLKPDE